MWIIFAFLSSLFASIMAVITKTSLKSVDAFLSLTIRTTIIVLPLWIILLIINKEKEIKLLNNKEWLLISLSAGATLLTWIFYFLALKKSTVIRVSAIDKLSIVFSSFFSVIFLKEKITLMTIIGIIVLLAGVFLVVFS